MPTVRPGARLRALLALTGLVVSLAPTFASAAAATPSASTAAPSQGYEVVELGAPPGSRWGWTPSVISDTGIVAGTMEGDLGTRVMTWDDGVFTDRGPGDEVRDIDDAGNLVGTRRLEVDGGTRRQAWLWRADGSDTSLGTQRGDERAESIATGTNVHGQVVGWWQESVTDLADRSAFVWDSANGMRPLARYSNEIGDQWGAEATGINDGGRISGHISPPGGGNKQVWWTAAGYTVVEGLLHPSVMHEDGSFSGGVWTDTTYTATVGVVWKDGAISRISVPAGATQPGVQARTDDGRWVGGAQVPHPDYSWATIWQPRMWLSGPTGPSVPLQELVQSPGWVVREARAMNASGEILAVASDSGPQQARFVLLRPAVARPSITATSVQHQDVPSEDWVEVPAAGTIDGNVVRISADVHNPGTSELEVQVAVLRDGVDVVDPADATIAAGQTRRVSLDWDTTGQAWDGEAPAGPHELEVVLLTGEAEETDTETTTLTVRPRPVFLVHGFNADASTWDAYPGLMRSVNPAWPVYAVGDGQAPGTMDTGSLSAPDTPANTLSVNGMIMDGYVDAVRDELDAQFFDVVAHSMGGLISRQYVSTHLPEAADGRAAMNQLVMLGTPNHGSPCASLMRLHGMWELRPEVVAEYNARWTNPRGVPMSVLAGDPLTRTCQSPVEGDGVVEVPSAIFGFSHRGRTGNIHTALTGQQDFASWVLPLLVRDLGTAPGATASTQRAASEPAPEASSPQLLTTTTLDVPAGGTAELPLEPGEAEAFGATLAAGAGVTAELLDPSGSVVAESPAGPGPFRTLSADSPSPGTWTLRLSAPTAVAVPVSAWVQGGPVDLSLRTPRGDRGRAELVVDLTRGEQPVRGATVVAELSRAGGEPVSVPLTARADGSYAASPVVAAGRHLVAVTAVTAVAGGTAGGTTRTTLGTLTVSGEPAPEDAAAPTTAAAADGKPVGGWYRDDVQVELSATDEGSGVAEVRWSIDGGAEQVVRGDRATVRITAEGTNRLTFWAVDRAGNAESPSTVEVRLDRTAPTLACRATPGTLWSPNHKLTPVAVTCTPADAGAGVGPVQLVEASSSEPDDVRGGSDGATTGDLRGWAVGTADTAGEVRAERDEVGTGRTYRLRYRVTDAAGNASTATASVLVPLRAPKPAGH